MSDCLGSTDLSVYKDALVRIKTIDGGSVFGFILNVLKYEIDGPWRVEWSRQPCGEAVTNQQAGELRDPARLQLRHAVPVRFVDLCRFRNQSGWPALDVALDPFLAIQDQLRSKQQWQHGLRLVTSYNPDHAASLPSVAPAGPPPTSAPVMPPGGTQWEGNRGVPPGVWHMRKLGHSPSNPLKAGSRVLVKLLTKNHGPTFWKVLFVTYAVRIGALTLTEEFRYTFSETRYGRTMNEREFPEPPGRGAPRHEPGTYRHNYVHLLESGNEDVQVFVGRTALMAYLGCPLYSTPAVAPLLVAPPAAPVVVGYAPSSTSLAAPTAPTALVGSFNPRDTIEVVENEKIERLRKFCDEKARDHQRRLVEPYSCPITLDIPACPVSMRNKSGQNVVFDYVAIRDYLKDKPNMELCPKSRQGAPEDGWRLVKCLGTIEKLEALADFFLGSEEEVSTADAAPTTEVSNPYTADAAPTTGVFPPPSADDEAPTADAAPHPCDGLSAFDDWGCPMCTYLNPISVNVCGMCNIRRC